MSISSLAMRAYQSSAKIGENLAGQARKAGLGKPEQAAPSSSFAESLGDSLKKVNEMQLQKSAAIESFATGQSENVHELMISMQKASVAMNMTSAVRNKVMDAYKELMRMPI